MALHQPSASCLLLIKKGAWENRFSWQKLAFLNNPPAAASLLAGVSNSSHQDFRTWLGVLCFTKADLSDSWYVLPDDRCRGRANYAREGAHTPRCGHRAALTQVL